MSVTLNLSDVTPELLGSTYIELERQDGEDWKRS